MNHSDGSFSLFEQMFSIQNNRTALLNNVFAHRPKQLLLNENCNIKQTHNSDQKNENE